MLVRDVIARPVRATIVVLLGPLLRNLPVRTLAGYEPSIDFANGSAVLDVVSLGRPASVVIVGWRTRSCWPGVVRDWTYVLTHYVILLHVAWYPRTFNWLARSSRHAMRATSAML